MREIGLIYLIFFSGLILLSKGVDTISACYFAVLFSSMTYYLYLNIRELKKAKTHTPTKVNE